MPTRFWEISDHHIDHSRNNGTILVRGLTTVQLSIPGEPVPKARPRLNRKTMTLYTPKETKDYETMVAAVALSTGARYTKGTPVSVEILLFTAKKNPPDCDNCSKSILDGLQKGGLLENDSQVWRLHITRVRSDRPRASVLVTPITESEES